MNIHEIDDRPSLVVQPFVFPKAVWEVQGEGEKATIAGIPGTWTVIEQIPTVGICCPNCRSISVLDKRIHAVDHLGRLTPSFICRYHDIEGIACEFHRDAYLDEWNHGKVLYAMSYHGLDRIRIEYTHASSVVEACKAFPHVRAQDVIAIGRAVGFAGDVADATMIERSQS